MNKDLDNPVDNPGGFYSHKNNNNTGTNNINNNQNEQANKNTEASSEKEKVQPNASKIPSIGQEESGSPSTSSPNNNSPKNRIGNTNNKEKKPNGRNNSNDRNNSNGKNSANNEGNTPDSSASPGWKKPSGNKIIGEKHDPSKGGLSVAKRGANFAKNTFDKISNNITNEKNNEPSDEVASNKQTDQDVKKLAANAGKAVTKVTGKVGKTLLKLFLMLPLIVKLIIIILLIAVFVIFFLFMFIYDSFGTENKILQANGEDVCEFYVHVNETTDISLYNYIKGIVYNNYKNENENFIEAFTILISSNIYNDYQFETKFDISDYNYYKFDYEEAPSIPNECKNITDQSDSEELKECANALSISSKSSYENITDKIKEEYGYITYIKNAILKFYASPSKSTISNVDILKNLSNDESLDYTEILSKFEEIDDLEIFNVSQCTISEDGSIVNGNGTIEDLTMSNGEIVAVRTTRPNHPNPDNTGGLYSYTNTCTFQCPWYAKNRAIELLMANGGSEAAINAIRNTSGDGKQWNRDNAGLKNFNGDRTCANVKAGSIIAVRGSGKPAGHVAIIEAVNTETNQILISEGWNQHSVNNSKGCNNSYIDYHDNYERYFGFRSQWWDVSVLYEPDTNGNYWHCYGITYLLEYNG